MSRLVTHLHLGGLRKQGTPNIRFPFNKDSRKVPPPPPPPEFRKPPPTCICEPVEDLLQQFVELSGAPWHGGFPGKKSPALQAGGGIHVTPAECWSHRVWRAHSFRGGATEEISGPKARC